MKYSRRSVDITIKIVDLKKSITQKIDKMKIYSRLCHLSLTTMIKMSNERLLYTKNYVKINEVTDFEFNIRKIFNKMSNRFNINAVIRHV